MPIKEAIWDARSQWRDIGRKLGLKAGDIRAIHEPRDGECLHEVLSHWIHTGKATTNELLKVLESKVIGHSDIAKEIRSLSGDNRTQVGLRGGTPLVDSEDELSSVEQIERALSGEVTLQELCSIPIEKFWYQLGIWLKLDKNTLHNIKGSEHNDLSMVFDGKSKLKDIFAKDYKRPAFAQMLKMFKEFINLSFDSLIKAFSEHTVLSTEEKELLSTLYNKANLQEAIKRKEVVGGLQLSEPCSRIAQELLLYKWLKRVMIVKALVKIGCREEAEKICSGKGIRNHLKDYLEITDPASNPPDCVVEYACYLRNKYLKIGEFPNDWPLDSSVKQHYTKLALIKNRKDDVGKKKFSILDVHRRIDDITADKENIDLDEVFHPIIAESAVESQLTILMDGAPGVGKTSLTMKLCYDWAKGTTLQEYHLVVLIPVRLIELDEHSSIAKLFPSESNTLAERVSTFYTEDTQNLGKRILFLFDGYDEAHTSNKSERSLLSQVIFGERLQNCSVLVTARTYASGYLSTHYRINRYIEILGFSSNQIKECIEQNLSDTDQAKKLVSILKERLDILSLCYIPLNCRIILFVYRHLNFDLPKTLTKFYEIFILHTIKHHVERRVSSIEEREKIYEVACLSELPFKVLEDLKKLCKLALSGLEKGQLSFEKKELESKSALSLGLMNSYQILTSIHVRKHYQFLHLTIQEFLAAMYLTSDAFSPQEQVTFFHDHISSNHYRMMLLFFAGLTKLHFLSVQDSMMVTPLDLDFDKLSNTLCSEQMDEIRQRFFISAHCAYEAQIDSSSAIWSQVIPIKRKIITFNDQSLSPFEELILAHFLSSTPTNHMWEKIDLSKCALTLESILYTTYHSCQSQALAIGMTRGLSLGHVQLSVVVQACKSASKVSVERKNVTGADLKFLCTSLKPSSHSISMQELRIKCGDYSPVVFGKTGIQVHVDQAVLCSFSFNQMLNFVDYERLQYISILNQPSALTGCKKCSHDGTNTLLSLCRLLRYSSSLSVLDLSGCNISPEAVNMLETAISINQNLSLKELNLGKASVKSVIRHLPKLLSMTSLSIVKIQEIDCVRDGTQKLHLHINEHAMGNDHKLIFENLKLPKVCSRVRIRVSNEIAFDHLLSFLKNNNGIQKLTLVVKSRNISVKISQCLLKLFQALKTCRAYPFLR